MSRWKAASIHLALGITVLLAVAGLLAATWYPPEFLAAAGGLGLIGILAGVDACVGPLLTLVVFKAGKAGLKFDLTVIAVLQIVAMGYGLHTIYRARPVYAVFTKDRFELVSAFEIPQRNLDRASREEYRTLPRMGPQIVAANPPEDPQERESILFSALSGGLDLQHFPKFYAPYAAAKSTVVQKGRPLDALLGRDEKTRKTLTASLENANLQAAQVKFLPLRAQKKDLTVLIDGASGEVLDIVDVDPW
jgi:hypothetical protein